jgi:hypothetical protein
MFFRFNSFVVFNCSFLESIFLRTY